LTRDLRIGADESLVVRAILNARKSMAFLHRLSQVESFPPQLRAHLSDELRKFAQRSQDSLEDSARADRSGRLLVLLRNNNLLRYESTEMAPAVSAPAPAVASAPVPAAPGGARRRSIIL
ncbi:MAG: hypothetical protein REJ50_10545, partial [Bordetella sp.]|nr:hypothetical protein [Bordetella sp.]